MLPDSTSDNIRDEGGCYLELFCETFGRGSSTSLSANRPNFCVRQLGKTMAAPMRLPMLDVAIGHVVLMRALKQVRGPNAQLHIAAVKHVTRGRAEGQRPREAVSACRCRFASWATHHNAVPIVLGTRPEPTPRTQHWMDGPASIYFAFETNVAELNHVASRVLIPQWSCPFTDGLRGSTARVV
jgi:hypothetical protein